MLSNFQVAKSLYNPLWIPRVIFLLTPQPPGCQLPGYFSSLLFSVSASDSLQAFFSHSWLALAYPTAKGSPQPQQAPSALCGRNLLLPVQKAAPDCVGREPSS